MKLTRREALAAGAAAMAMQRLHGSRRRIAGGIARRAGAAERPTFRLGRRVDAARRRSAAASPIPLYAAILERECELLVPENELKWQWIAARARRVRLPRSSTRSPTMRRAHGFKLRGHTLFWTPAKWYPKWLRR